MIVAIAISVAVLVLAIIGVGVVRAWLQSRVRRQRRFDTVDSVDELSAWRIGGIDQWVQIRGASRRAPILFYIHGGPGMPMLPFAHAFQRNWEKSYIVVHWDQRNTGKTLTSNGVQDRDLSLQQHVSDGLEIVSRLQSQFPNNPVVLVGHSWGTAIAVEMIRRNAFPCSAYLAIGQVSDFLKSERYGYATVLAEAERRKDKGSTKRLRKYAGYPDIPLFAQALGHVRKEQIKLGFADHENPRIMIKLLWLAFQSLDYRWRDLLSLLNPMAQKASLGLALRELPGFAKHAAGTTLTCPVIMTGGEFDLFTPTPMAREFLHSLIAPTKVFIDLEGLAHFGPVEAPERFDAIVLKEVASRLQPSLGFSEA